MVIRDEKVIEDINVNHRNTQYFNDTILSNNIVATKVVQDVTRDADIIFLAIPAQAVSSYILIEGCRFINCLIAHYYVRFLSG